MKLNELSNSQAISKSWSKAKTAPKSHEIAYTNSERATGSKDRVMVNFDFEDPKNSGFLSHTHPVENGPGTIIGALPSGQDLETAVKYAIKSGYDSINKLTNTFIDDPSDVDGMIIWHGPFYTVTVPGNRVNLSRVNQYEKAAYDHDFQSAVSILKQMGFYVEYGQMEDQNDIQPSN